MFFGILTMEATSPLEVEYNIVNMSKDINNASISLRVDGGVPPYTYYWSDQNTSTESPRARRLTEGMSYKVRVVDAADESVELNISIPAESIVEKFNGSFKPIVDKMASVLFWDVFASLGLRDPVVYQSSKFLFIPDWQPEQTETYVLKSWEKEDGARVKKGEILAIIQSSERGEIPYYAVVSGVVNHSVTAGSIIYDPNDAEYVIRANAHQFGQLQFDEPRPMTHPNGDPITKGLPFIVIWLVAGAAFFTIRMGFINFRGFRHALQLASGKFDDPNAPGRITHFQALSTAVSATVGLGNIAGVAIAISLGGAGATFWMIVAGLLGMSSKFVECTLGVKYRFINEEGRIFGGPMNYLRYGLEKRNMKGLGKVLAVVFAILAIGGSFGGGNMFQANQSFDILSSQLPFLSGNGFGYGVILSILVGVVIIGGINSIAKVTAKVVPFMAAIYILGALIVIGVNFQNIGAAFSAIISGAFTPGALKGGFIGVLVVGFQRAAFSNEAGVGSAAIAHSAAKTNHPPSEGFVALLEPFIDTVVVCTLTALVLIFTGKHEVTGLSGVELTSSAFGSVISWFPYVLSVAVFLFAFSTMISWSYYGMRAWTFLFGKSKKTELAYKFVFLLFVVLGSSVSLGAVLDFSDMMILAMSFPNIIGLYIMSGEVKKDLNEYLLNLKKGLLYQKK
ncbi:MAG: amino acid carrier protein [Flavobacteriales bacterium]|nr:MAG: amino acid carrier protein [Flavobacteriales bacterium]